MTTIRVRRVLYARLQCRAIREGLRPSEMADDILRAALRDELDEKEQPQVDQRPKRAGIPQSGT